MSNVERGNHGDALQPENLAGATNLTHLAIQVLRGPAQIVLLGERAGDLVGFVQDEYIQGADFRVHDSARE